jgi:uncharacterized protein YbaP (TraB family)
MNKVLLDHYRDHPEFRPLMAKTFDERNVKMAERIETFLKDSDAYFVLVGAGHLVGDKGIVRLLQDKKYKVEQLRRNVQKKAA